MSNTEMASTCYKRRTNEFPVSSQLFLLGAKDIQFIDNG